MRPLAAIVFAALLASVVVLAFEASAGSQRARRDIETLHYVIRFPAPTFIDNQPAGFSRGDAVVVAGELYDARNRRRVGRRQAFCVQVDPGETLQCSASSVISGRGQLVDVGSARPGGEGRVPIVGGTGDFEGARGSRTLKTRHRTGDVIVADLRIRLKR